jgi:hypothetical protein
MRCAVGLVAIAAGWSVRDSVQKNLVPGKGLRV